MERGWRKAESTTVGLANETEKEKRDLEVCLELCLSLEVQCALRLKVLGFASRPRIPSQLGAHSLCSCAGSFYQSERMLTSEPRNRHPVVVVGGVQSSPAPAAGDGPMPHILSLFPV